VCEWFIYARVCVVCVSVCVVCVFGVFLVCVCGVCVWFVCAVCVCVSHIVTNNSFKFNCRNN